MTPAAAPPRPAGRTAPARPARPPRPATPARPARPARPPAGRTATGRTAAGRPTVRTAAPARSRRRLLALLVVVGVTVLTIAGFHAMLAQTQVHLEDIRARTARAETRYEMLRLEHGRLTSPVRITARAAELGLGTSGVAAVAVPLAGEVPRRGESSAMVGGWAEVKRHLDATP